MFSIIQESNNPYFNLAAEEYLLHERKEDFLILSVNDPSVIIGKHQVAHREVNTRFTDPAGIPVIRRISGGGTVYHDRGNLNFAFIRQSEQGKQVDFRYYTQPVIGFLASLGITAVFEGKNDLTVDGLKISGNAEHVFRERVLHHGTLLYNASIENMGQVIKPGSTAYSSRAVESNRTSVTNLGPRLKNFGTIESLMAEMLRFFQITISGMSPYSFSQSEIEKINELADSKYRTWEWNWGYGPPYTFSGSFTIAGLVHNCRFLVKDGIIWASDISGSQAASVAGKKLIGCRHMPEDIRTLFRKEMIHVTDEEIYDLF